MSLRRLPVKFYSIYGILSLGLSIGLLLSIEHVFRTGKYDTTGGLKYLIVWACLVNVSSALLLFAFGRRWHSHFVSIATTDLLISLTPFVLIRLLRMHSAEAVTSYIASVYVAFISLKCLILVFYACANSALASPKLIRVWVLLSSLIVYSGFVGWITQSTWPTGDGVHYLLLTHSLVTDHDIDLANNYKNGDYHAFYPPYADEHAIRTGRGEALPIHDIGLSVLMVPGYILGGKTGALLELALPASLCALGIFELSLKLGADVGSAVFAWALFSFTAPILVFASEVSPEILGASLLLWAVIAFINFTKTGKLQFLLIGGALLSVLPWVSIRFWMFTGPLLAVVGTSIIWVLLRSPTGRDSILRSLIVLMLPIAISITVFAIYDKLHYGILLPNAGYVLDVRMQKGVFAFRPQVGFLGMFLDRAFGLFPTAPIYFLSLVGAFKLWKANRLTAFLIFVPTLCYVIFLSFSQYWYGGWSPPARLLVTALALCAPLAAVALSSNFVYRLSGIFLGLWTVVITFIEMAVPNTRYVAVQDTTRGCVGLFLQQTFGFDPLTRLFPSFIRAGFTDYVNAAVWVCLLAIGIWWLTRTAERRLVKLTEDCQ